MTQEIDFDTARVGSKLTRGNAWAIGIAGLSAICVNERQLITVYIALDLVAHDQEDTTVEQLVFGDSADVFNENDHVRILNALTGLERLGLIKIHSSSGDLRKFNFSFPEEGDAEIVEKLLDYTGKNDVRDSINE